MTLRGNVTRMAAITVATISLAGCFGSAPGGAGPGGGGGTPAPTMGGGSGGNAVTSYDTAFSAVQMTPPTQTALNGVAVYTGEVSVRTDANSSLMDERVFGDLAMTVDFDAANDPITATVNNIAGEINGVQTSIGGELSTANANNQVNAITATTINVPGQGQSTVTGMSLGLEGTLTDPTGTLSGDALMTLQGNFVGNDGAGVFGASAVAIRPSSGPDFITGGTFYAEK